MKYIVKFIVVTFLLIVSTYAFAEQKIAYIDMKFVLNNSKAGKGAQDFLQKSFKQNQEKYRKEGESLRNEEKDLLKQKVELRKLLLILFSFMQNGKLLKVSPTLMIHIYSMN